MGHLQGPVENWSETLISRKIYIFYDNFVGSNVDKENIWTYVIFKFEVFELAKKTNVFVIFSFYIFTFYYNQFDDDALFAAI